MKNEVEYNKVFYAQTCHGDIFYQQIEAMSLLQLNEHLHQTFILNIINREGNHVFVKVPQEQLVLQFVKSKSAIINLQQ